MSRKLGEEPQVLRVRDPISGSVLTLYYRTPSSEERLDYQTSAFRIDAGGPQLRLAETRLAFGLAIMTGFAPGDFSLAHNGEVRVLEIDADGRWKDLLRRYAPDLVSFLGQYVFEGLRVAAEAASPLGERQPGPGLEQMDGPRKERAPGWQTC